MRCVQYVLRVCVWPVCYSLYSLPPFVGAWPLICDPGLPRSATQAWDVRTLQPGWRRVTVAYHIMSMHACSIPVCCGARDTSTVDSPHTYVVVPRPGWLSHSSPSRWANLDRRRRRRRWHAGQDVPARSARRVSRVVSLSIIEYQQVSAWRERAGGSPGAKRRFNRPVPTIWTLDWRTFVDGLLLGPAPARPGPPTYRAHWTQ